MQAMSAHSDAEVDEALEEAGAAALVRETGNEGYAFQHVLIQQALYSELSARRKQRLHRAAGEARACAVRGRHMGRGDRGR
jgi:predicted ATPase